MQPSISMPSATDQPRPSLSYDNDEDELEYRSEVHQAAEAREEELRHQRYLSHCRMRDTPGGVMPSYVPLVANYTVHTESGTDNLPYNSPLYENADRSIEDEAEDEMMEAIAIDGNNQRYPHQLSQIAEDESHHPQAEVVIVTDAAPEAYTGVTMNGSRRTTPFGTPDSTGLHLPPVPHGDIRTSRNSSAASNAINLGGRRPSDVLGRPLSATECEQQNIALPITPISPTASKSLDTNVGNGSESTTKQASLLASLPPEHQMVLAFSNISSWVAVGNYGAAKKKFKDMIKPKALAGSIAKPFVDTAKQAGRIGSSAAKQVGNQLKRGRDIESGADPEITRLRANPAGHKQILYNLTGSVRPGEVLALMGPSGSGKTSLLSIVGGRAPKGIKMDGSITVNGMKMTKATRKRIGFVLQDDVLYETLTVKETLEYAGRLRLPRTMSREEKMGRVDAVIQVLGLAKSRDTIIGGYFRRGVSGGERKRVSVGHELLINPAVLLLDEPTSGLDSTTALHLVNLLRDLAAGGRAVLTTIHQPSSRLYRQLDQVMLLAEGHMMYYGDALRAVDWFNHLGFGLPYGTNLADHILDCATGEVTYDDSAPGAVKHEKTKDGKERSVHGMPAVRMLYTTFENWYREHPQGFSAQREKAAIEHSPMPARTSRTNSTAIVEHLLEGVKLNWAARRVSLQGTPAANAANIAAATPVKPVQNIKGVPAVVTTPSPATTATTTPQSTPGLQLVNAHAPASPAEYNKPNHHVISVDGIGSGKPGPGSHGRNDVPVTRIASSKSSNDDAADDGHLLGASFSQQVTVLWQRAVNVRRFESLSLQQWIQLILVGLITGALWWQRGQNDDINGAADVLGLLFFEMLFVSFRSLFSALFTFPNEFRMLSKERPSGMYKLSAYYIARILADLPIELFLPTLFIIIVYFFGGLRYTAGAFFSNWASTLLIVLVAQSWGLLIGGLFMDPKMAQTVTTVLMLSFMLVGGYYVRNVPVWIGWLKYCSFVYWGYNLLIKIQYRGSSLTNCAVQTATGCAQIPSSQLQGALRLPTNPDLNVWPEVIWLLGCLFFLRWVTYLVLKRKTQTNQKNM